LVTVDATINFDQVKVTQETTDGQSAPRPAASTHASSSQTAPSATDLSVDDESVARPHDVSSREHTVHRLEQIVSSPGSIHKLTVGVLLKGPLDASTQARVGELVAAAVGLVPSRGDSITTFVSDRFAMPAPAGSQLSKFETAISASHLQMQNSVSSDSVSHLTYVESNWLFIAASLALAAVIAMVGILLLNGRRRLSAAQRADYIARLRKLLEEEGANEAART
jgi:flagellar M-ring protein FliF